MEPGSPVADLCQFFKEHFEVNQFLKLAVTKEPLCDLKIQLSRV